MRPLGTRLTVDGFWPALELVVEFQEEQHSKPSPFFDRRQTVSGVGRGKQHCLYDERKCLLIPMQGWRVVIEKSAFVVKSKRIVCDPARDIAVVRERLGNERPHVASADIATGTCPEAWPCQ